MELEVSYGRWLQNWSFLLLIKDQCEISGFLIQIEIFTAY